ncbi:MAG: hypothetical protein Q9163_001132 [Psora crenata]
MPPDSPQSEHNDSSEESPSLSDQNVAILYEIVQNAEQHPNVETQPFRALFAAYDSVLPQYGLDPAHDQIYLRFLFTLGDKRGRHESLFESFERLLEAIGIQIEFNTEDDVLQDVAREIVQSDDRNTRQTLQRRPRRASFNSIYDAEDESTYAIRPRAESRASMSRLQLGEKSTSRLRPSRRATSRTAKKVPTAPSPTEKRSDQSPRRRLTGEEFASNAQNIKHKRVLGSKIDEQQYSRQHSAQSRQNPVLSNPAAFGHDLSISPSAADDSLPDGTATTGQDAEPFQFGVLERFYPPSRTQLLRDAEIFQSYCVRSVTRSIIDRWCDAALQARNHHEHLERMAVAHDTEILLRQAFEYWRTRLHAKQRAAETERFFNQLEQRATKARNLYLLTKALTHWAQYAQDEALRSFLVRQQVLGIKYFCAWRDIALENKNKVRYQGLKKCFGVWKQRYVCVVTNGIKADMLCRHTVLKDSYWRWFWSFCDRRAPEWHARTIKQRLFFQWASGYRRNVQQLQVVDQDANRRMKRNVLIQWLGKTRACLSNERRAVTFNQRETIGYALRAWSRKQRLAPLVQIVANMADWRVAGSTFTTFVNRFRLQWQAQKINRLRLLRNSWTRWNDRLRQQTMAHRIDDRYLLETLYKWVIAGRLVLLQRLSQQRLKARWLQEWLLRVSARQRHREQTRLAVEDNRAHACLRAALTQWLSRHRRQRQAQQIAFDFHAPKVAHDAVSLWKQNLALSQQMDAWAKDTRFFFLGKRSLKRWGGALLEARRQKRRNTYVQVRRRSKMSLASGILRNWCAVSGHVIQLQQQADSFNQQRLLRVGVRCFDHWRNLYDLGSNQGFDAQERFEKQMLKRFLRTWADRINVIGRLEYTAEINAGLRVQRTAFTFLRKLRLRSIELKGQQGKAKGLRLNYEKRHSYAILRQWLDKTIMRQNPPQDDRTYTIKSRRLRRLVEDDRLGARRRIEDWTYVDGQPSSASLPGHLSTPLTRAARTKALMQSTTPVGTPFQNRLRAQLNATPRIVKKEPIGTPSALGASMFGAMLESPPRTARTPALQRDD